MEEIRWIPALQLQWLTWELQTRYEQELQPLKVHQEKEQQVPDFWCTGTLIYNSIARNVTTPCTLHKIQNRTVSIDMKDERPASDVRSPNACIKYPRLTQKPNSIPELRVWTSSHLYNTSGTNGTAAMANRTALKVAGSTNSSTSFTTGILLATAAKNWKYWMVF